VLGSTLNVDAGAAGSRALGESQGAYTIDPRLKKDSAAMWATICRDLVRPFLSFNLWRTIGR
jgi:phage gp29-like protein